MTLPLAQFQDQFAKALMALAPTALPGIAAIECQPGFAVYRNTVMKGCIDALQANYPVVTQLVGEEWFRAAAALYVRQHQPHDARMLDYGRKFADFLANFEPAAELPYLSSVARLDRFWTESHVAADEPSLDPAIIAELGAHDEILLTPHASARWAWFPAQPIYTIWNRNRSSSRDLGEITWQGEGALLVRPEGVVVWCALDQASCAFLDACQAGRMLGDAVNAALEVQDDIDLSQMLARLLEVGAFGPMRMVGNESFERKP